jgi:Flp pilus assembly protein TadG
MKRVSSSGCRRKGAIAALTALALIPILGMVGFSVDMGYVVETRAELQNAADAAALAAAEQLNPYYVQYYSPGAAQDTVLSNAKTAAKNFASNFASYHKAGNCSSIVLDTTNDVQFGYQDSSTPYQSPPPTGYFPNTVQVTLRLDGGSSTNPQLGLFFGPVLGTSSLAVTATARATIYNGDFSNFTGADSALLPATLDQEVWNTFCSTGKGSLPDFSYTAPTSSAPDHLPSPAVSGAPQILVVPDPNGRPGGWNYLSLDSSANSNSDFKSWFSTGMTQSDYTALTNGGQLPLPAQPSDPTKATYYWKGSPGDKGTSEPFPAAGAVRVLPLYMPVPVSQSGTGNYIANDKNSGQWDGKAGDGQNCWFNIVTFVCVVITDNSNGLNVQPAAMYDTSVSLTNIQAAAPPGTGNQIKTFFTAPKLTN